MGRGKSKAGAGGGTVTTLALPNGDNIDLSDSPLKYGAKDSALSGKARKTVEEFENKRYGMKTEYSRLLMDDGSVVSDNHGGKGSVGAKTSDRMVADVLTHNHPRQEGVLGGGFSEADLGNFVGFNQHTYRATAKEGTYSISKTSNFKGYEMLTEYKKANQKIHATAKEKRNNLQKQYNDGKIDYSKAQAEWLKTVNKSLVDGHNWLLENQKKYGYTYTLEKR